jgi:hypothetical protein
MDITVMLEKLALLPKEERFQHVAPIREQGVVLGVILKMADITPMQYHRWRKAQEAKTPASIQSEGSQS